MNYINDTVNHYLYLQAGFNHLCYEFCQEWISVCSENTSVTRVESF